MNDYIVKLLPVDDVIRQGDLLFDNTWINRGVRCKSINYETKKLTTTGFAGETNIDKWKKLSFFLCSEHDIKEGDDVVIEYLDGNRNYGMDTGKLTTIWNEDEGPYCSVDYKHIDLASEGHTSLVYKKICPIEEKWVSNGMLLNKENVRINAEWISERAKCLKEGDLVEMDIKDSFPTCGTIKSIHRKEKDAWDWDDELEITDVKKVKFPSEDFDMENPEYESFPDRKVLLSEVRGKPYIEYSCEIQCPHCKHFH